MFGGSFALEGKDCEGRRLENGVAYARSTNELYSKTEKGLEVSNVGARVFLGNQA